MYITDLEKLQIHLRRRFEEELNMNNDGTTMHIDTINHCLLYAFGKCNECCIACDRLFVIIQNFINKFEEQRSAIEECCDNLYYFLAHQARKVYLNS